MSVSSDKIDSYRDQNHGVMMQCFATTFEAPQSIYSKISQSPTARQSLEALVGATIV